MAAAEAEDGPGLCYCQAVDTHINCIILRSGEVVQFLGLKPTGFSGFLNRLWSLNSIVCSLWVVNCQPSSSLAARVEDRLSCGLLVDEAILGMVWTGFTCETVLGGHLRTQIIRLASFSHSSLLPAPSIFSSCEEYCLSPYVPNQLCLFFCV